MSTTKAQVQLLVRHVADLRTRLQRAEGALSTVQVRVDCYERMLEAVLQGLGLGRPSYIVTAVPTTPVDPETYRVTTTSRRSHD